MQPGKHDKFYIIGSVNGYGGSCGRPSGSKMAKLKVQWGVNGAADDARVNMWEGVVFFAVLLAFIYTLFSTQIFVFVKTCTDI